MQADIYEATITQDITGTVVKRWAFKETVDCTVRSMLGRGTGRNSTEFDIENYINVLNSMIKLRSQTVISSANRVANIRNSKEIIYKENQDPASEGGLSDSTIFEPRGSVPIMNFDGSIIEYETVLLRQEVQELTLGN